MTIEEVKEKIKRDNEIMRKKWRRQRFIDYCNLILSATALMIVLLKILRK